MNRKIIVKYWMEKASEDLASTRDNFAAGRLLNAVRDACFTCFHSFSALLLQEGRTFKKHKEVRSILHRDYIRTKKIGIVRIERMGEMCKENFYLFVFQ